MTCPHGCGRIIWHGELDSGCPPDPELSPRSRAGTEDVPVDILVRTGEPHYLDRSIQQLAPAFIHPDDSGGYLQVDGCYVVRALARSGYVKYAIDHQRYGEVVRELDELL